MSTNHPKTWFENRAGQTIQRNGRAFTIPNKDAASYCLELQEKGFSFTDPQETKKPTVTMIPDAMCTACEG